MIIIIDNHRAKNLFSINLSISPHLFVGQGGIKFDLSSFQLARHPFRDFPLQHQKGKLKSNNIPHTVLPQFAIQENSQWQPIELLTLSIATSALTISP
jgi:hypothetical protein